MNRITELLTGSSRRDWLIAVLLTAIAFCVFLPTLDADFVNYDDKEYVSDNPAVTTGLSATNIAWAFTTFHNANWHPLTWLSLQLDATLGGRSPRVFHLTNMLLHAANAAILFVALRALTGALWRSAAVTLLFAIHPLRVESVAWVSERKDVLSSFFGLLALLAYAYYVRERSWRRLALVALALALSLLAKPMYVTLPFLFLVLDWWPLRRMELRIAAESTQRDPASNAPNDSNGRRPPRVKKVAKVTAAASSARASVGSISIKQPIGAEKAVSSVNAAADPSYRLVSEKLPLFVLVLASAVVSFVAQKQGGAVGDVQRFPIAIRLENAAMSYVAYLGKTVFPVNFSPFYPHPGLDDGGLPLWKPIAAGLFLIGVTALAIGLRNRAPYVLTGWLWYLGTLVPVIGLVQVGNQGMADRYTYFPQVGILLAVCWGAANLIATLGRRGQHTAVAVAYGAAATLAVLTWKQAEMWHDSVHLWEHAIAATGGSEPDFLNYGGAIQEQGHTKDAAKWFREMLDRFPNSAQAMANLGYLLSEQGDQDEALRWIKNSLSIEENDPETHSKLGIVLYRKGDIEGARREQQYAVDHNPLLHGAWANLGLAELTLANNEANNTARLERAAACHLEALRIKPDAAEARSTLGNILIRLHRDSEGLAQLKRAVHDKPEYAEGHNNLGRAYTDQRNMEAAAREFTEAIRLFEKQAEREAPERPDPGLAVAWYNLGAARGFQGRNDEALECITNAIERDPQKEEYRHYLGLFLEHLKKDPQFRLSPHLQDRLRQLNISG
jgi:tetratricopeptide (TPR) repeat protein